MNYKVRWSARKELPRGNLTTEVILHKTIAMFA